MTDTAAARRSTGEDALALLGDSAAVRALREGVARCALGRGSVLLTGDGGTGAADVATAIHERSTPQGPFETLVCTSSLTPDDIVAALRSAAGGTLYAENVDAFGLPAQRALLAALRRAPSREAARVVAFTAVDLEEAVARGEIDVEFAAALVEDTLSIPPLRDRREDIGELALAIVARADARSGQRAAVPSRTLEALRAHRWPRNLPELVGTVEELLRVTVDDEGPQETYRVRVRRQTVSLMLADATTYGGEVFLTDEQRIEDAFEREAPFMAVATAGGMRFHALRAVAVVSVPRDRVSSAPDEVEVRVRVRLLVPGDHTLEGALSYAPHEARKRSFDHLNGSERALLVHGDGTLHVVSKSHIAYVEEGA